MASLSRGRYKPAQSESLTDPECISPRSTGPPTVKLTFCFSFAHLVFSSFPLWSVFTLSANLFLLPSPLWSLKVYPPPLSPSLQPPCPSLSFSLCLERKRWPLNVSAGVWGSGEQPSHCVTPRWTPDGLMNKGSPPPPLRHLFLHSQPPTPFIPDPWKVILPLFSQGPRHLPRPLTEGLSFQREMCVIRGLRKTKTKTLSVPYSLTPSPNPRPFTSFLCLPNLEGSGMDAGLRK